MNPSPAPKTVRKSLTDFLEPTDPPVLQEVFAYWLRLRGDRPMPRFSEIDPVEIPTALSRLYVLDVLADGDFVYRLAGEDVSDRYGESLKGKRISEIYPKGDTDAIISRWRMVAADGVCCLTRTVHATARNRRIAACRLLLPLGDGDRRAQHVLGVLSFEELDLYDDQFVAQAETVEVRVADIRPK